MKLSRKAEIAFGMAVVALGSATASAQSVPNAPTGPIERKYYADGPSAVTVIRTTATCDSKGNVCNIFYPANIASSTAKLPLILWANGTGGSPDNYQYFLKHLSSWGFVIVATRDDKTGYGNTVLDTLAFMKSQAATAGSPFYNRIDFANVGSAGHSQGAAGAANAMINSNGQVKTAVVFHLPQQYWSNPADNGLTTPTLTGAKSGSIFYISGTQDGAISPDTQKPGTQLNSLTAYYNATPSPLLKAKGLLVGPNHNDILGTPGCNIYGFLVQCNKGVYGYLGLPTAWLAWQLKGDTAAGAAFKAGSGEFFSATAWTSQVSNVP